MRVTGGSWLADKEGGFYRAIVAMTGTEKDFGAHVFLRWLALSETNPVPKVMATVHVEEVNDQKLVNIQSILRGKESNDNEITIIASSYDFDADKEHHFVCRRTAPSKCVMVKAPAKALSAPPPKGRHQCPKDDQRRERLIASCAIRAGPLFEG